MFSLRQNGSFGKIFSGVAAVVAGLGLAAASRPAAAMTFQAITGPAACAERACILAEGGIDKASPRDFARFLHDNHVAPGALVVLNSEGGVLVYGLSLGEAIRRAGLATTVAAYDHTTGQLRRGGQCASACAFTFLGGVERDVGKGSLVGVHQVYSKPGAVDPISVSDAEWLASRCADYVEHMGGGVGILVEALRTPPEHIHWFSANELSRLAVVTPSAIQVADN